MHSQTNKRDWIFSESGDVHPHWGIHLNGHLVAQLFSTSGIFQAHILSMMSTISLATPHA